MLKSVFFHNYQEECPLQVQLRPRRCRHAQLQQYRHLLSTEVQVQLRPQWSRHVKVHFRPP
jgi:hypothetical protein